MSDFRPSAPFPQAVERSEPDEFDDSIFDRVGLPLDEDSSSGPDDDADADRTAPQREGLPPGFRMRHDAHYVEELTTGSLASAAPAPTSIDVARPRNGHRHRDAAATMSMAHACAEIGQGMDAIGACLRLFPGTARPAHEQVALDLMAAEVHRATWLLQALSVLDEDPPVANVQVELGSVVNRVVSGLMPGRRHAGSRTEAGAGAPGLRTTGDDSLLTVAVAGMAMALQAATDRVDAAIIDLGVREAAGRAIVEATQTAVRLPASWRARFLDPAWTDRPGGRRVAVALAASARVAELHHGTLTIADAERGGCRLVLSLPCA
jgi:hypothetical protein